MLSEISQIKTNTVCYYLYVESKNITNYWIKQKISRLINIENKLVVATGERKEERSNKGIGGKKDY